MSFLLALITSLSNLLEPLAGSAATAVAIIVFTMSVRLALHPLARAAFRGEKARARLAPEVARLREEHRDDPKQLMEATAAIYKANGVRPTAGCLPMLLQLPVFFVTYQLFTSTRIGGGHNSLLDETLFAAPLGDHWIDALSDGGLLGAKGLVFLGLFAAIIAVTTWSWRRARRTMAAAATDQPGATGAMAKILPLLSFGTVVAAAYVPLAAGLYLLTSTAWAVTERAVLQREKPVAAAAAEPVAG